MLELNKIKEALKRNSIKLNDGTIIKKVHGGYTIQVSGFNDLSYYPRLIMLILDNEISYDEFTEVL